MSNEAQPHVNHHVSALDPVHDVSPGGGYPPRQGRDGPGRRINPRCGAHPGRLYGTLVLAERRSGYVIMLVGSLRGLSMPLIRVMGAVGVIRSDIAKPSDV